MELGLQQPLVRTTFEKGVCNIGYYFKMKWNLPTISVSFFLKFFLVENNFLASSSNRTLFVLLVKNIRNRTLKRRNCCVAPFPPTWSPRLIFIIVVPYFIYLYIHLKEKKNSVLEIKRWFTVPPGKFHMKYL